jgi:hypothetical protein
MSKKTPLTRVAVEARASASVALRPETTLVRVLRAVCAACGAGQLATSNTITRTVPRTAVDANEAIEVERRVSAKLTTVLGIQMREGWGVYGQDRNNRGNNPCDSQIGLLCNRLACGRPDALQSD